MRDIILEDTTLRDGEQAPGVAFSIATKIAIHDLLVEAGVRWIEVGIPAMGGDERKALATLLARGSDATLIAWNRGVQDDLRLSLDMGFRAVHIGLPASDILLRNSVNRDRSWLINEAATLIAYCKDRGSFVSVSAEDVGRTEVSFLQEYAGVVYEAGADRLRLSDTIGILMPSEYRHCVEAIANAIPIDLQCHTHNDFGLAVANTLAGIEGGARYFHATVLGIGERAGMPDLASIVMMLKHLRGIDVGIDGTKLMPLYERVAKAAGVSIMPWQPIVGSNIFAHESGIHVNAMLRQSDSFESLDPQELGVERRYVLGKHSGRALIRMLLESHGVTADDVQLQQYLDRVRDLSIRTERAISIEDLLKIVRQNDIEII